MIKKLEYFLHNFIMRKFESAEEAEKIFNTNAQRWNFVVSSISPNS